MSTSEHPDELLPWYVNGSLEPQLRAQVEEHLQSCARCRAEVAFLETVRKGIRSERSQAADELGLRRLMRTVRRQPPPRRRWWRPALAVAVLVIVAQAVLLASLQPATDAHITLLGEASGDAAVIQVQFAPQATEAQIRALLNEINGEFIAGPGALGIYRIRLADVDPHASEEVEHIVERLRRHPGVVLHAARE